MIDFKSTMKIAINSLKVNKLRSALTSLGIIIGVSAVIIMLAIGTGASKQVQKNMESMGSNILTIRSASVKTGGVSMGMGSRPSLTLKDASAIQKTIDGVDSVAPVSNETKQIMYGNQNWSTTVYGTTPSYLYIKNYEVESGRSFTLEDVKNSAKDNGIISQQTIDKNYDKLKALNPGLERDEIIPADLSIRLPKELERDIITMDKYAAKGAKYFKKEGVKLNPELKALKKEIEGKSVYTSNGKYTLNEIAQVLSDGVHPINITVLRNGKTVELKPIYPDEKGLIGIGLVAKQTMIKTNTPVKIIKGGSKYLWDNTYMMMYSLGQLFTGNVPLKEMHGVVAITKIGGDMIEKAGKSSGILLAALISMNLAILNILPIPALDGGHLIFLFVEKVMGRPLDEKVIENISSVFFSLLIILMIFVVFNDITLLVGK